MTVLTPPAYLQGGTYTALSDRQHLTTARNLKDLSDNSRARGGLLPDTMAWSAAVSATGFSVTIGPFRAIVTNTFAAGAGDYEVISTGNDIRAVTPSSPTTNRIDYIGVIVNDAFYSGAINAADVVVVPGTPAAGTPSPPALPASFLPFYMMTINASSTTPTFTDMRRRTGPVGCTVPIFATQLADSGSYIGEKRIVPASGSLPMREMYYGSDLQWHGVNTFQLQFPTISTGTKSVASLLSTLNVPDPGYAYFVNVGGAVWSQNVGGNGGWWFRVYRGPNSGGIGVGVPGIAENVDDHQSVPVIGSHSVAYTGASSLQLWTEPPFGGPGVIITSESGLWATIVPA